jgi:PAS domain S-box-containing protein
MEKGILPRNEKERLEALINYNILETMPDAELEKITQLASFICQTPIALISIIDGNRQFFKSKIGLSIYETPKKIDFCELVITGYDYMEVQDAQLDPQFNQNPSVYAGPHFRFFGGVPLTTKEGFNIGSLCVIDLVKRQLSKEQKDALKTLGTAVINQIELRKQNKNLQSEINQLIYEKINQTEIDLASYKFALDQSAKVAITDPDGIIRFVNDRFCKSSKYDREELVGQEFRILNSGFHSKDFMKGLWETIRNGKVWRGEIQNMAKGGDYYWDEISIIPFLDKKGKPYQYVAIIQDITDKKSSQERLILETTLISILSENEDIDNAIRRICTHVCDEMGWVASTFWRFNAENTKLVNKLFCNFSGENLESFEQISQNAQFGIGEGLPGTVWKNKEPLWIFDLANESRFSRNESAISAKLRSALIFPIMFNNEVTGVMEFFSSANLKQDLNIIQMFESFSLQIGAYIERKKAEEELLLAKRQAEESVISKDQFLANMSHEIRTPMNAIIGYTDLLSQTTLSLQQREFADSVRLAGVNLLHIINDILDFSKIESGTLSIGSEPAEIRSLLNNVYNLLKFTAINKGLEFEFKIDDQLPEYILCDTFRLNQILINLVGNAIKFTEKGSVHVIVKKTNSLFNRCELLFNIKDTGVGIPDDKKDDIFERFSQVNNEINRKYEGTGLGLSISKNLIELMGGKLQVKSTVGLGSEFYFYLHFDMAEPEVVQEIENEGDFNGFNPHTAVLLVEDNQLNQVLAKNVLEKHGLQVTIADNGIKALEHLALKTFDLILMDLQMPESDGYQTTAKIRNELKSDIPIIAMTAHSIVGEKEKCLAAGMNDFISKPFDQKELINKIYQLLSTPKTQDKNTLIIAGSGPTYVPFQTLNLDYLQSLSDGNKKFEAEMIEIFLQKVPQDIFELTEAFNDANYLKISEISHKLKSSVAIFGRNDLEKTLSSFVEQSHKRMLNREILHKFAYLKNELSEFYPLLQLKLDDYRNT